jgi:hypothetical protein
MAEVASLIGDLESSRAARDDRGRDRLSSRLCALARSALVRLAPTGDSQIQMKRLMRASVICVANVVPRMGKIGQERGARQVTMFLPERALARSCSNASE